MEFDRFHHFANLLIEDDFVLTYSGYVTEDILQAIGDTLRQQPTSQPAAVCRNKKSTSLTAPVASSISIHKK
jgi:hypothetical protein